MDELKGTVERLIFHSADNGFSIFVLALSNQQTVLVKGHVGSLHPGEEVHLQGAWVFHKKFGNQFEATRCIQQLPTTIVGIKKYLSSGLIKGIGAIYADRLVNYFGADVLTVIEQTPERLNEIEGIGPKRISTIVEAFKTQKDIHHLMIFLQERDISPAYATKIYKTYGHNALAVLHENPYRLADDIWGIGFKIADSIAQKLGFDPNSTQRVEAAISYIISQAAQQGHLYIVVETLKEKIKELLQLPPECHDRVKLALHNLYEQDKIKLITENEVHYVTLSQYYHIEKSVAQRINTLLEHSTSIQFDFDRIYASLRNPAPNDIELNEDQQRGIMACLQNKITIITGGPGTGKTTLIKKLLSILESYHCRYKLAAPTGRAAKRIIEGTGRFAATIHRLLEFDVSTMRFGYNETHALPVDFLILDEASMIDIFLAQALLKALPFNAHLLLIGDVDQLPSVGAGNFLNDLIASEKITRIKLTHIFRQAQDSLIIVNAHKVNHGEFPVSFLDGARRDFKFIKEDNPEAIFGHLEKIYTQELKKHGLSSDDAMVLVPMNRGVVGTHRINQYLQKLLNPQTTDTQLVYAGTLYTTGDRVMQIRNNYDKGVFNGDIGTIESVSIDTKVLLVRFFDKLVEYDASELDELVLAYAISIHKSQGSEYSAAIVPLFMQHFTLLQRNLVYTAITRAKKLCILIGQPKAIAMAIKNNRNIKRTTFLKQFLTTDLTAR